MKRLSSPRRWIPFVAVAVAVGIAGAATFALGGSERRPTQVPPISTPRLRALFSQWSDAKAEVAREDDDFAPADDPPPTLAVLTAGGLPDEPSRRDLEQAMDRIRSRVLGCQPLEQFVGILQVRLVIEKSGNVKSAQVLPPLDQTQTGQCVAKEARHAQFPRFRGMLTPTVELTYPYYFAPADN